MAGVVGLLWLARPIPLGTISILTWSGLRGGISVALALSLPLMKDRDLIVATTYMVVILSIIVQGLTVGKLTRHFIAASASSEIDQPPLNPIKNVKDIRGSGDEVILQ